MSININKIITFCSDYLQVENFDDYCHNGLQIEGKEKISRIVMGVTFSEELINYAIKRHADLVIVHHGIGSKHFGEKARITGFFKKRIKLMLENNIALAGFHLPLDAHSVIGNNVLILKSLGLKIKSILATEKYNLSIGYIGEYSRPMKREYFVNLVNKKLNTKSFLLPYGSNMVKRVGVISGGAVAEALDAHDAGCDTYLCGEIKESIVHPMKELQMNFINAGHYNTETLGLKKMGELIARKFNLPVEFIDIPCEV